MIRYYHSKKLWLIVCLLSTGQFLLAQNDIEYEIETNILYRDNPADSYVRERCVLDIYYPTNLESYPTLVWFHGGGLTGGQKFIPRELMEQGMAIIAVNYRLSPKVKALTCIEDAAAAVAWCFRNIERYGGTRLNIFVTGHSAGGYLTSMIGLDKSYLEKYDIDANDIAGLIPYSGHTITHFTMRKENGIEGTTAVVDEFAPLHHVRPDASPMIMITGDRDLELLGRYEENAYFVRMMQEVGHKECSLYELEGFNHGEMAIPAHQLLLKFIQGKL